MTAILCRSHVRKSKRSPVEEKEERKKERQKEKNGTIIQFDFFIFIESFRNFSNDRFERESSHIFVRLGDPSTISKTQMDNKLASYQSYRIPLVGSHFTAIGKNTRSPKITMASLLSETWMWKPSLSAIVNFPPLRESVESPEQTTTSRSSFRQIE